MSEEREVGVGPHEKPWPDDERLDKELLAEGDRRNVLDRYRYWSREAIVVDLDTKRNSFHIAIENFQHDFNIGTIVRNANAFLANTVHIIGKKRWNRRGAMVTDRYQHVMHHSTVEEFVEWAESSGLEIFGVDITENSTPIEGADIKPNCVLVFGQEGPGLTDEMISHCLEVYHITQYGSTRSINVGVASGIAMYEYLRKNS